MVDHLLDRSRFVDRILMDPHNVMNTSSAAGSQQQHAPVGIHTEGNLDFLKEAVDLGTSIMAVAYDGGVVIGADSRTSTGVYISNRASDKITAVDGTSTRESNPQSADPLSLYDGDGGGGGSASS